MAKGSKRTGPVFVPCGRCGYCLKNRQLDWAFRLNEEFKQSAYESQFITLTYNDNHVPTIGADSAELTLSKLDAQNFIRSLRKQQRKFTGKQIRYYCAGEYGTKGTIRPHLHYLIFNLHPSLLKVPYDCLQTSWTKGNMQIEPCRTTEAVCNYVASYIINKYDHPKDAPYQAPFQLQSKRPYLGHSYVDRMGEYHRRLNQPFLQIGAETIQRLPRFIREKIWTTEIVDPKVPVLIRKHFGEIKVKKYLPPVSWKENALNQDYYQYWDAVHNQVLARGSPSLPEIDRYLAEQKIHHERYIKSNAKKNGKL